MARTGLAYLIETVRGMTDTALDDYWVGATQYWDNSHIQTTLDNHRFDVYREQLGIIENWAGGGTVTYLEYQSQFGNYEVTTGGTAVFFIEDGTGANVGTASYTPDYQRGRITFGSTTGGTVYYLTGRSYDLNAAAAEIWRKKAGHYATAFDVRTDNHQLSRSQIMTHCISMADYYDSLAGPQVIEIRRGDYWGGE